MSRSGRVLKLVIIGDGGIGKTTLTKVFCENTYLDQIMTIGIDIHTKESVVNGQKTTLQIWDISGQSQFKFLLSDFIRSANGVVLAFDCSRKLTFLNLDEWIELIRTYEPNVPIFLIATKLDEGYDPALSKETIAEFIQRKNLIGFEETSAKAHMNVEIPWKRLIEHFLGFAPDSVPLIFSPAEKKLQPATSTTPTREAPSVKPISPLPPAPKPEIPVNPTATPKPIAIPLTSSMSSPTPSNLPSPMSSPSPVMPRPKTIPKPVDSPSPMSPPSPVMSHPTNLPSHADSPSPGNAPATGVESRSSNVMMKCPHCNTPFRESQIKLKMEGKQVFCRGCLKLV